MVETIVFPDATQVAIDALVAAMPTAVVRAHIPSPRPAAFVTVRRSGGIRRNIVTDEALLVFEAWAPSDAAAEDLAQQARAAMFTIAGTRQGTVTVFDVNEVGGPANDPDPVSGNSRFVFSMTVATRGTALT